MKKLFIGLLIVAAGAGIFYFLQKKKTETNDTIEKELLIGKWKIDSVYLSSKDSASDLMTGILRFKDSSFLKQQFDFQTGGTVLQTLNNLAKTDTSYYQWNEKNELLIKDAIKDSIGELFTVHKLNMDSLILQSKDSAVFVFTKFK